MSDGEIMDALKAKYPQPMTNRSLALMSGELYSIGITNIGFGSYVSALTLKSGESGTYDTLPPWEVLEQRWNKLLDQKANLSVLFAVQNESLSDKDARLNPYVLRIRDILVNLFGATIGPDGLLEFNAGDAFLEALDRHDENLREARDRIEKSNIYRKLGGEVSLSTERVLQQAGTKD